jgi:hypothetical protein
MSHKLTIGGHTFDFIMPYGISNKEVEKKKDIIDQNTLITLSKWIIPPLPEGCYRPIYNTIEFFNLVTNERMQTVFHVKDKETQSEFTIMVDGYTTWERICDNGEEYELISACENYIKKEEKPNIYQKEE